MLAVADTALDLLVLQLVLHRLRVGVLALVLGILAPVDTGPEDDVLADSCRICGAGAILCTFPKLAPRLAIGDARIDRLRVCDVADPPGRLYFLALVVVAIGDGGLGAVLVRDGLRRRQVGYRLLDIVIVGPVVPDLVVGSAKEGRALAEERLSCSLWLGRRCSGHDEYGVPGRGLDDS